MNRRRIVVALVIVVVIAIAAGVFVTLFLGSAAREAMGSSATGLSSPPPGQRAEGRMGSKERAPAPPRSPVKARILVERNGVQRASCDAACALEAECGFRAADACKQASCDGDVRTANRADFCLDRADTCAQAASCPCEEACWKRGECAGDHAGDAACTASCTKLVAQDPATTYDENRCVIESKCDELAVCGQVQHLK